MGSLGNPRTTWAPFLNTRDCSQGFCSVYCPQWCYKIFPPPPPPSPFEFPEDNSGTTTFSPLVIAIIGILASAFLLVTYYALISKFCRKTEPRGENRDPSNPGLEEDHNHDPNSPSIHEPWLIETIGLDEALIKSITVCKYKKGVSLIDKTCSVCLSEFQEDESIRLLPKCTHAFHIPCIDTWLKSRSNCPLCRSDIVFTNAIPIEIPGNPRGNDYEVEIQQGNETVPPGGQNPQSENHNYGFPKTVVRGFSDLGTMERHQTMIEIREEECLQRIRRAVSMDHPNQSMITVANILCTDQEDSDSITEEAQAVSSGYAETGSSKDVLGESSKKRMAIKRSFSSGILPLIRSERSTRGSIVPV